MPRRPSEVLELREAGYSWESRFEFDRGLVQFKHWFEGMRDEVIYVAHDKTNDGKDPKPKWTAEQILGMYSTDADPDSRFADDRAVNDLDTDAIVEAFVADEPLAF